MDTLKMIRELIEREGGYCNDGADAGGETCYGVTVAEARRNGYQGAMRDLPLQFAVEIYTRKYWTGPRFSDVAHISQAVAEELFDTGVNCGPTTASQFLQRALNALNDCGKLYADIAVDGALGPASLTALRTYIEKRGKPGETVLLRALNALQGHHYLTLAERKPSQERFMFGWFLNRVG